jgi:hypothetical protein
MKKIIFVFILGLLATINSIAQISKLEIQANGLTCSM